MHPQFQLPDVLSVMALASLLAACGGGDTDVTGSSTAAAAGTGTILRGGAPTPAPAPDVLVRESFGLGPDLPRPAGGQGGLRATYLHTTLGGLWVKWPGSKSTAWMRPDGNQTWKLCGANPSPYELPSPLQG